MTLASQREGVESLVPADPAALSTHYYLPDEIHLTPEGAEIFTVALASYLPQQLLAHEPVTSPDQRMRPHCQDRIVCFAKE